MMQDLLDQILKPFMDRLDKGQPAQEPAEDVPASVEPKGDDEGRVGAVWQEPLAKREG